MINIVLFNDESVLRIARRAISFFSDFKGFRTSEDIIWLNGVYVKFSPRLITLNSSKSNKCTNNISSFWLNKILHGEEIYISDDKQRGMYIQSVGPSTAFDSIFTDQVT